jgi:hypothetical protein
VIGERAVEGEDATGAKSIFLMSCRLVMGRLMFHTRLPALTPDATERNALFLPLWGPVVSGHRPFETSIP